MFLHDLHSPHDARFLAVRVVEESQLALLHSPEVVAGHVVADPCSSVNSRYITNLPVDVLLE